MHTGLHFIPLRTPGGKSTSHIGIFVEIAMSKLSQKQASSSGICSLQNVKSPSEKLSSSRLFEACKFTLDQIEEDDIISVAGDGSCNEGEKNGNTCSVSKNTTNEYSTVVVKNRHKLHRQEAIVEFTVEVSSSSSHNLNCTKT